MDRLYLIEISKEKYELYLSKCSKLSKSIKKAKKYDRLGTNINFRAVHFNKLAYEINENINNIKKISSSNEKNDYLFHYQSIKIEDD